MESGLELLKALRAYSVNKIVHKYRRYSLDSYIMYKEEVKFLSKEGQRIMIELGGDSLNTIKDLIANLIGCYPFEQNYSTEFLGFSVSSTLFIDRLMCFTELTSSYTKNHIVKFRISESLMELEEYKLLHEFIQQKGFRNHFISVSSLEETATLTEITFRFLDKIGYNKNIFMLDITERLDGEMYVSSVVERGPTQINPFLVIELTIPVKRKLVMEGNFDNVLSETERYKWIVDCHRESD